MKFYSLPILITGVVFVNSVVLAERYDTGFESGEGFDIGGINLEPSTAADVIWWENSAQLGSGDNDQEIQSTYVHSGTQAFRISNAKGHQQAIANAGVQIFEVGGESGASTSGFIGTTGFGPTHNQHGENITTPVPTSSTRNALLVSYLWRTVTTTPDPDFGFSVSQTDLAGQRMTWMAYGDINGDDTLRPRAFYYELDDVAPEGYVGHDLVGPALQWGQWYHTTEEVIHFLDVGPDGSPEPDKVRVTIRADDNGGDPGSVLWSAETGTWEAPFWVGDFGADPGTLVGIDAWTIRVNNEHDIPGQTGLGIVIDDFTFMTMDAGNINNDSVVNIEDLQILADNFGSANASWLTGDMNHDNLVGMDDLQILADNYNAGTGGPVGISLQEAKALAGIPEPSTLLLVTWAGLVCLRRPKRV